MMIKRHCPCLVTVDSTVQCKFLTVNHLNLPNLGLKSMSMAESLELYDKFNLARGVDMITVIDCGSN